jgi:hypothetical protein
VIRKVIHYQSLVEDVPGQSIHVEKYFSYIVMKSPFVKSYYPIEKLFSEQE